MTDPEQRLRERLAAGPPLVLDGATGTELERLGIPSELPLWSARTLIELAQAVQPFLVYANRFGPGQERSPREYAELASSWIEAGARLVGGCCGTRPEQIRALSGVADANCVTRPGSVADELPQPREAGGGGPTKSRT